jgi:hypothetical protein
MVEEARTRGFRPKDNNEADALAILSLAQQLEGVAMPVAQPQADLLGEAA